MTKSARWLCPLALVLGAGLGACSSTKPPKLTLVDARLTERTAEGVALAFTLDATNSNDESLPLKQAKYTLELDGKPVFSGVRSPEATIRRRGEQQFTLPAGVALGDLPAEGKVRFRISGTLQYLTPGAFAEVLFDAKFRRPKVSFAQEGEIDLAAAPSPAPSPGPALPLPTETPGGQP